MCGISLVMETHSLVEQVVLCVDDAEAQLVVPAIERNGS